MKTYPPNRIKNIAIIGHASSGKTTLAETILIDSGGSRRHDFDPEEIKRKISIKSSIVPVEYMGYKLNILDTPGYVDFIGEAISGLSAADGIIFLCDAVAGLGIGAQALWNMAEENNLPRVIFVNRLDKERSNYFHAIEILRENFGKDIVPVQIPIGSEANFFGIIDILYKKAYKFENGKAIEIEIPQELNEIIEKYRDMLIEEVVEIDEHLLEKFMNNEEIADEEIYKAFQESVDHKKIYPVMCGSAQKNIGVTLLMNNIENWLPNADERVLQGIDGSTREGSLNQPFSGYVFSTMIEPHIGELSFVRIYSGVLNHSSQIYNSSKGSAERAGQILFMKGKNREETPSASAGDIVALPKLKYTGTGDTLCDQNKQIIYKGAKYPEPLLSISVKPKSKADQEKMGIALNSLTHEDPTFKVSHNIETKETIISGMGDIHLEVMLEKQKRRYGVEIDAGAPRIPYKETIRGKAKAQGKYKKQSGGRGQYGDCSLEIEPLRQGGGFQFVDRIAGGVIPKNYIPSIEKGIKEAMQTGVIAGYPVMDVKVTLYDGSFHEVDSSDMAFKIAGSMGFKKAFIEAVPKILEPIMTMEIVVPGENVGDVVSDINKRRGKILGIEQGSSNRHEVIKVNTPYAEIAKYASDLRSITRGQGYFSMKFSHYEEAPHKVQLELVNKYEQLKAAGELSERSH